MSIDSGLLSLVRAGTRAEAATTDEAWLRAMLEAEAALARAQGFAAEVITSVAARLTVDPVALARRARQSANPVVPLAADLTEAVRAVDPAAAEHVHAGATSQDILDTATMLVARRTVALILDDLDATMGTLAGLAETHRGTVMPARTLGRHAVPTTFGWKAAGWLAGLLHARDRLRAVRLPAQLGGAAGTLAALAGPELVDRYAAELGLAAPRVPWQSERTVIAELGAALSATAGAVGKAATDVILLAQDEVGEVAESSEGGSSSMPHKRNPALSVLVRSAALQVPVYAQVLASAQLVEHERATGGWQAEWQALRECLRLTGGAVETARELMAGLRVFPDRMKANMDLTGGTGAAAALVDRVLADYRERP